MLFTKVSRKAMAEETRKVNKIKQDLEEAMQKDLKALYRAISKDFKSVYSSSGLVPDQKSRYGERIEDVLVDHMTKVANIFSRNIRENNEKGFKFFEKKQTKDSSVVLPENEEDDVNAQIAEIIALYILMQSEKDAQEILKTNEKEMSEMVRRAEKEISDSGDIITLSAIGALAAKKFLIRSESRTQLIAFQTVGATQSMATETEASALNNSGATIQGKEIGGGLHKNWDATLDNKTRAEHTVADARYFDNPIPLDDMFIVGGEALRYPRDPNGTAGNVINCVTGDSKVQFSAPEALTRRFYKGVIFSIETASGNKITVTPNHPILTDSGWVAASLIKEGDSVVSANVRIWETFCDFNVEDVDTSIEQVFNSINVVSIPMRVAAVNVDFHGEVTEENVDVISTNSFLGSRRKSFFSDCIHKLFLPNADFLKGRLFALCLTNKPLFGCFFLASSLVRFFSKFLSFIKWHLLHFKKLCFASVPYCNTNSVEAEFDCASVNSNVFRYLFNRISFIKKIFTQCGLFFNDRVTVVSHDNTSCYVYNLSDKKRYHICNGIVNHNCRCESHKVFIEK